jgi:hypothetical protein
MSIDIFQAALDGQHIVCELSRMELIEAERTGRANAVRAALDADPSRINAKDPNAVSLVLEISSRRFSNCGDPSRMGGLRSITLALQARSKSPKS